jgi:hypothetical protein
MGKDEVDAKEGDRTTTKTKFAPVTSRILGLLENHNYCEFFSNLKKHSRIMNTK